jgi:hypothetical protein
MSLPPLPPTKAQEMDSILENYSPSISRESSPPNSPSKMRRERETQLPPNLATLVAGTRKYKKSKKMGGKSKKIVVKKSRKSRKAKH